MTTASSKRSARRVPPGRPWKPGQSGNPCGLPKDIAPAIMEARRLALSHAPKAIARLAELLDDEDPRVVVAAAEGLLDRAGLRPFALEPERLEVLTAPVDLDALRAALTARVAGLLQPPMRELPPASPAATPAGERVVEAEATPTKEGAG